MYISVLEICIVNNVCVYLQTSVYLYLSRHRAVFAHLWNWRFRKWQPCLSLPFGHLCILSARNKFSSDISGRCSRVCVDTLPTSAQYFDTKHHVLANCYKEPTLWLQFKRSVRIYEDHSINRVTFVFLKEAKYFFQNFLSINVNFSYFFK